MTGTFFITWIVAIFYNLETKLCNAANVNESHTNIGNEIFYFEVTEHMFLARWHLKWKSSRQTHRLSQMV